MCLKTACIFHHMIRKTKTDVSAVQQVGRWSPLTAVGEESFMLQRDVQYKIDNKLKKVRRLQERRTQLRKLPFLEADQGTLCVCRAQLRGIVLYAVQHNRCQQLRAKSFAAKSNPKSFRASVCLYPAQSSEGVAVCRLHHRQPHISGLWLVNDRVGWFETRVSEPGSCSGTVLVPITPAALQNPTDPSQAEPGLPVPSATEKTYLPSVRCTTSSDDMRVVKPPNEEAIVFCNISLLQLIWKCTPGMVEEQLGSIPGCLLVLEKLDGQRCPKLNAMSDIFSILHLRINRIILICQGKFGKQRDRVVWREEGANNLLRPKRGL